jgi:hypothetical protein
MGEVVPFPRARLSGDGLQAALRELEEAMAELKELCDERDRLLLSREVRIAGERRLVQSDGKVTTLGGLEIPLSAMEGNGDD